jgi:hypothetical protein
MAPTNRQGGELRPRKNEQLLDVKFQVQTYVAHTAQLEASNTKAGAP